MNLVKMRQRRRRGAHHAASTTHGRVKVPEAASSPIATTTAPRSLPPLSFRHPDRCHARRWRCLLLPSTPSLEHRCRRPCSLTHALLNFCLLLPVPSLPLASPSSPSPPLCYCPPRQPPRRCHGILRLPFRWNERSGVSCCAGTTLKPCSSYPYHGLGPCDPFDSRSVVVQHDLKLRTKRCARPSRLCPPFNRVTLSSSAGTPLALSRSTHSHAVPTRDIRPTLPAGRGFKSAIDPLGSCVCVLA